jgi:thiol-disulfide isomerase/thioredoxin
MIKILNVAFLCILMALSFSGGVRAENPVNASALFIDGGAGKWVNLQRPLAVDELDDRLILLDFWTFCCINCIQALPILNEIHKNYGDKISIIGVHSGKFGNEKTAEPILRAIGRYQINHAVYNDDDFAVWKNFEVKGWPTLILLDSEGRQIWRYFGEAPYDQIAAALDTAIEKATPDLKTRALPVKKAQKVAVDSVFYYPSKIIELKGAGYALSDSGHNQISILNEQGQVLQNYAGFNAPQGMAYDRANDLLYVANTGNHQLKRIDLKRQKVKLLAGIKRRGGIVNDKPRKAMKTALASPWDLALFDGDLILANAGSHQLLRYSIKNKKISVFAGNGKESIDDGRYPDNSLSQPSALAVMGDDLYFLDSETSSLRRVDKSGKVETLLGSGLFDFGYRDGTKSDALMQHPLGLEADPKKNRIFIADSYNHVLRIYDVKSGHLQTISGAAESFGTGTLNADEIQYHEPNDILLKDDGRLIIVDTNNHRVIELDPYNSKLRQF